MRGSVRMAKKARSFLRSQRIKPYYESRAQLWELQALTRARAIAGRCRLSSWKWRNGIWRERGQRPNLFAEIDGMLRNEFDANAAAERDALDFKTGTGGMIEAEFLVQALQMRAGIWKPNLDGALAELARHGAAGADTKRASLKTAYDFLRRCESVLRRWENKSVSTLPSGRIRTTTGSRAGSAAKI